MVERLFYKYDEPKYDEIFKNITYPGIKEDLYMISNYGNVFNKKKKIIMKTYFDKDDHEKITLVTNVKSKKRRGNKSKHFFIHRLVAWDFIGHPPDEYHNIINHKNGIPCCNFVHNLEWCSILENTNHAKKMNLLNNSGINSSNCKYSEKLIRKICELLEDGYNNMEILEFLDGYRKNGSSGLYNLINKLSKKTSYWDIVSEYDYKVPLSYFKCDEKTQKMRDLIFSDSTNLEIMKEFGYNNISDNKTFYNKIINERQKCKVLFNDYRKYKV